MNILSLNALCAAPYGSPLLEDISFNLEAGQVLGLMGPNGAGKSSLLHCIAGGVGISSGELSLLGRPLAEWQPLSRARTLAMQVQNSALNFPFSVEEVIMLGRTPHASGNDCDQHVLTEVMAATDTTEFRHRPYTQLSGGEKQRVQLARAVAQIWREEDAAGRLLLLDEPNSALDLSHQQMILALVSKLARKGCAIILATHDFNLLSAHADRLLVMRQGRQHQFGAPMEVLTPALFQDVFDVQVLIQAHPDNQSPLVVHR
ncbi:MAG: heme ABC transporter ATP-binding protein [Halioglobus sp.]